jgi:hypothetical protein
MNQEEIAKFDGMKDNYSKCYELMAKRGADILTLVNTYPTAFVKFYLLNTELRQPVREIERLIIETEKLFYSGVFERCGSNLENCIKTIDKIISNTSQQIELVKSVGMKIDNDKDAEELLEYEIRLSKELVVFKEFKESISKLKEHTVS